MNELKEINHPAFKVETHGPFYSQAENKYYACDLLTIEMPEEVGNICFEGEAYEDKEVEEEEDDDPTPWCMGCQAAKKEQCKCGDFADNY
jgi:hypothetical protein